MFRFYGGQVVKKGIYWNLSGGESIEVENEKTLPGGKQVKYLKVPNAGVFILGPFFGLLFVCLIPLMSLLIGITLLSRIATASEALKSDEAQTCMGCHSSEGMVKTFKNKETLSVSLNEGHFKGTVHDFLTCTGCHSNVSMDNHPSAQYASKKEFAMQVTSSCRTCHADEQLFAKSLHKHAITRANAPPCSDCHGSHSIKKTSGGKETASNSQYCLTCHKKEISLSMNGEILSLTIDEATLRRSVHSNHDCTDCHVSFSRKDHPVKKFGSKRELSITISNNVCKQCHPDKYTQLQDSIHVNTLLKGNKNAPVCTDCHGAHSVGPKAIAETMSGVPCKKCHEGIFETYKVSVHGKAKTNGKDAAPICSDCHSAHEVKHALSSRSPRATCLGCHKNAADLHNEWLPNADIHLEAVACTACHVPDVERRVYLRVTDSKSGAMITDSKVKEILGASYNDIEKAKEKGIEGKQFWDIYQKLTDKDKTTMSGTLALQDCNNSHMLAPKTKAVKQCEDCHSADSKFFKNVTMAVSAPDGRETFYNVSPAVLSSMFTILPLNQFYALGSTRIKLLDILGILMVVGGMSVPIAHVTLRILTSPIREAKRLNKLRKEGKR